ncbi:MAG: two-component system sensor histidine kinase NtrB [Nitrospirota bacterium]
MGTLAAGLAHEINNPLVPISTFLQMLPAKRRETSEDSEYWGTLYQVTVKEVERIRGLIRQLLTYSKFTGESASVFEAVDFNAVLGQMAVLLTSQARTKGVSIEVKPDTSLGPVHLDQERMKQVFLNLMLNAIQAMPSGGTLTVSSRATTVRSTPHVELRVTDTGVGISEENLERLFTPFFTTKGHEGSGLGLLTCHQVVEEHRGTISVESVIGRGTTFVVSLPLNPRTQDRRNGDRRSRGRGDDESSLPAAA